MMSSSMWVCVRRGKIKHKRLMIGVETVAYCAARRLIKEDTGYCGRKSSLQTLHFTLGWRLLFPSVSNVHRVVNRCDTTCAQSCHINILSIFSSPRIVLMEMRDFGTEILDEVNTKCTCFITVWVLLNFKILNMLLIFEQFLVPFVLLVCCSWWRTFISLLV